MIGGHIDLAIDSMTTIWPLAKAGEVRALGVSTPQRVATAPDLPTIGETVPGFEATGWQGLFAPVGSRKTSSEMLAAAGETHLLASGSRHLAAERWRRSAAMTPDDSRNSPGRSGSNGPRGQGVGRAHRLTRPADLSSQIQPL